MIIIVANLFRFLCRLMDIQHFFCTMDVHVLLSMKANEMSTHS